MGYTIKRRRYVVDFDYKIFFVIYPDASNYDFKEVLSKLDAKFIRYAYALHDKDVTEDGEIKKPHIHIYGELGTKDRRSIEYFASNLGVPNADVDFSWSRRGSIRYLIHLDDLDKYPYSPDIIVSNFDHERHLKMDSSISLHNFNAWAYDVLDKNPDMTYAKFRFLCHHNNFDSEFTRTSSEWFRLLNH